MRRPYCLVCGNTIDGLEHHGHDNTLRTIPCYHLADADMVQRAVAEFHRHGLPTEAADLLQLSEQLRIHRYQAGS